MPQHSTFVSKLHLSAVMRLTYHRICCVLMMVIMWEVILNNDETKLYSNLQVWQIYGQNETLTLHATDCLKWFEFVLSCYKSINIWQSLVRQKFWSYSTVTFDPEKWPQPLRSGDRCLMWLRQEYSIWHHDI